LELFHRSALEVLETTGVRVEHDGALKLFAASGCDVNFAEKLVKIPVYIIEEALRKCPSSFKIKARNPKHDLLVGGDTIYFMQGMGMRHLDLDTWETRPATVKEHREAMIVADALDNLHLVDPIFIYMDRVGIPPCMVMLENLASGFRYSSKAEHFGYQQDCEIFAIKMAKELGVNLNIEVDTAAPLTFYQGSVEATFRYVEAGFPVEPCIGITAGAEGPATLSGSLVLGLAQVLAFVAMVQLKKPGSAISVQHALKPMDMQRGTPNYGLPGFALTTVVMNQLLRRYRIPSCTVLGFTSTSKKIDFQCGYEKSMGALISALTGGNLQIFHGGSGSELIYNPELSILDDDVAGWIGRFLEGVAVNDETLAVDVINEVGPIPGHFLNTAHTRKWWRAEHYATRVADREVYPVWVKSGKKDALDHARERMREILATHKPEPLSDSQERAIRNILDEARNYYREKGLISDQEWAVYMETLDSAD